MCQRMTTRNAIRPSLLWATFAAGTSAPGKNRVNRIGMNRISPVEITTTAPITSPQYSNFWR